MAAPCKPRVESRLASNARFHLDIASQCADGLANGQSIKARTCPKRNPFCPDKPPRSGKHKLAKGHLAKVINAYEDVWNLPQLSRRARPSIIMGVNHKTLSRSIVPVATHENNRNQEREIIYFEA